MRNEGRRRVRQLIKSDAHELLEGGRTMNVGAKGKLLVCMAIALLWSCGIADGYGNVPVDYKSAYSLQNSLGISVSFDPKAGSYSVDFNNQSWLGPAS